MKNSEATILPVFYKVDPHVVRHALKDYAEALRKLEEKRTPDRQTGEEKPRYGCDTIQNWRKTLNHVGYLKGFKHGDDDDEAQLVEDVVERVLGIVPKPLFDVAVYPTGLDEKLEDFENTVLSQAQLDENRVEAKAVAIVGMGGSVAETSVAKKAKVVAIVGMGGAGKTTLAKRFFNFKRSNYKSSSFLFEVRENARTMSLAYLQRKLLKDLTGMDNIKIDSCAEGIVALKMYLLSRHSLIILDDIGHASQLEALLPIRDVIDPDSLILAISRDKSVFKIPGVLELEDSSIYNLKGLNESHSTKLSCSYAFNQPLPPPEFVYLANRFVKVCDGLPLSLKVFGALVCRETEAFWEEILNEFDQRLPNTEIQESLEITYNSLSLKYQQTFVDIACFFIGRDRNTATRIWGMVGLQILQNKCLLEVDTDNSIKMHDHIRDMGRNISKRISPCRHFDMTINEIDELLERSSFVMVEVRGVTMPVGRYSGHKFALFAPTTPDMPTHESNEVFGNTPRQLVNDSRFGGILSLRFVATEDGLVNDSRFGGILSLRFVATEDGNYLERILKKARSPDLQWLCCYRYPYSCLPFWIPMKNLRVLDVAGSRLEMLWQHESQAPLQLRELTIWAPSFSSFPESIGQLKCLESIALRDNDLMEGVALKSLPEEFCDLRSLKSLHLGQCGNLTSLPDSFGMLITNLELIHLWNATSFERFPESFGNLTRLKDLSLSGCINLTLSNAALGNITTLESLSIRSCKNVRELPPQVANQRSLVDLDVAGTGIKELPTWIGDLCNLRYLTLGNDLLEVLPPLLSSLKSLTCLRLEFSPRLKILPGQFAQLTQLRKLYILRCGIEYLPKDLPKMNNLGRLVVGDCPLLELPFKKMEGERETSIALNKLETFHDNDRYMYGLQQLELFRNIHISEAVFPEGVCPNLRELSLWGCEKLTQIGGLSGLPKLQLLDINGCVRLEELPNIEMLVSLKVLNVSGCKKLKSIPGLCQLTKLRKFYASECEEMLELSGVEHLMFLNSLYARKCPKLEWGAGVLEQLRQRLKEGLKL